MKSYFQGLITGIFLTASLILFMGQTTLDKQNQKTIKRTRKIGKRDRNARKIYVKNIQ